MDQELCARSTLKCYRERERMYFLSILHLPVLVYIPLGDLSAVIQTPTLSVLEVAYSLRLICDACIYRVRMAVHCPLEFSSSIVT